MNFNIWKPLFANDFDVNKYLYHYTSFNNAIKIICMNSLFFSNINEANEKHGSKIKLVFDCSTKGDYILKDKIYSYFDDCIKIAQMICFSTDSEKNQYDIEKSSYIDNDLKYYDVSGRGFALPRMWEQYADKHEGVCFIFNRENLIKEAKNNVQFLKMGAVNYRNLFDVYYIDNNKMKSLYNNISNVENGSLTLFGLVQKDTEYLEYNFFTKISSWSDEHEFRIIALTNKKNRQNLQLKIGRIASFLEGIVIGEKINDSYEQTIKLLVENLKYDCELKKIYFGSQICSVSLK